MPEIEDAPPSCEVDQDRPELSFVFLHTCFDYVGTSGETRPVRRRTTLPLGPEMWLWNTDRTTITPSIHCERCGTHGFWRDGAWQKAP